MVNNLEINITRIKFILFLVVFYLFPVGDNFRDFVIAIFMSMILFLFNFNKIRFGRDSFYMLIFLFYLFVTHHFRNIFYYISFDFYIREYTEIFRILVFFVFTLCYFKVDFQTFKIFIYFTVFYVFLDFIAVIYEQFDHRSEMARFIVTNYQSSTHADFRQYAKGLTTHGGLHGVVISLLFMLHFLVLPYVKRKSLLFIACLIELYIVLSCGSRTHVVTILFFLMFFLVMTLFNSSSFKRKSKIQIQLILASIVGAIFVVTTYRQYFFKVFYLIQNLEEGDSKGLGGRADIWMYMINKSLEVPELIFVGWGKTFFLTAKGGFFTDSDYLAVLFAYGLIPLLFFLGISLAYIIKIFFKWKSSSFIEQVTFYILMISLIMGIASQGFFTFHWQLFMLLFYRFYKAFKSGKITLNLLNKI